MNSKKEHKDPKQFPVRYRYPPKSDTTRPKKLLLKAIYVLPEEVLDYFTQKPVLFCWDTENSKSEVVRFNDKDTKEFEFVIHFSSSIWGYTDDEIFSFMLIQIAHCYLGNESGFWSYEKNKEQVPKQEYKAQQLANKWVQNYVKNKFDLNEKHQINIPSNLNAKPIENRFIDYYS